MNPVPITSSYFGPGVIKNHGTDHAYAEFEAPGHSYAAIYHDGTMRLGADYDAYIPYLQVPVSDLHELMEEANRVLGEVRK